MSRVSIIAVCVCMVAAPEAQAQGQGTSEPYRGARICKPTPTKEFWGSDMAPGIYIFPGSSNQTSQQGRYQVFNAAPVTHWRANVGSPGDDGFYSRPEAVPESAYLDIAIRNQMRQEELERQKQYQMWVRTGGLQRLQREREGADRYSTEGTYYVPGANGSSSSTHSGRGSFTMKDGVAGYGSYSSGR